MFEVGPIVAVKNKWPVKGLKMRTSNVTLPIG